jgi:hypothetical protein
MKNKTVEVVFTFPDKGAARTALKKLRVAIAKDRMPYEATIFETAKGDWALVASQKKVRIAVKVSVEMPDAMYESIVREAAEQDTSTDQIVDHRLLVAYVKRQLSRKLVN